MYYVNPQAVKVQIVTTNNVSNLEHPVGLHTYICSVGKYEPPEQIPGRSGAGPG